MKMTKAFTMIELIFVVVILGILSAVALPKFSGIRNQADIVTGKAQIATIRTAIANERQGRLILGDSAYITAGNAAGEINDGGLFGGVLTTPITNSNTSGNWNTADSDNGNYNFNVDGVNTAFVYEDTNGTFTCTAGANNCNDLVN